PRHPLLPYTTLFRSQVCLCGSRILVERGIYAAFREAFVARVLALRPGDPMDDDANLGPLVSQAHFDKVVGALERARDEGARVLRSEEHTSELQSREN